MGSGYPPIGVGSGVLGGLTGALSEDWSSQTYVGGPAPRRSGSHRASSNRPSWRTPPDDRDSSSAVVTDSRRVAIGSVASRVTGFLRTLALGAVLGIGAGSVADPYNTANGLPTVVYELLLGGVLSAVFIPLHGDRVIEALGAATSLSYVVGAVVGHHMLRAKIGRLGFAPIVQLLARLGVASALAGLGGYLLGAGADHALCGGRPGAFVGLLVGAASGLVVLLIGSRVLRITEVRDLAQVLRR